MCINSHILYVVKNLARFRQEKSSSF